MVCGEFILSNIEETKPLYIKLTGQQWHNRYSDINQWDRLYMG